MINEKRLYLIYSDKSENNEIEKRMLNLDIIDRVDITLNSAVTTHPLIEGDSISDHMYRKPASIRVSGTFSEKGKFKHEYSNVSNNRLKSVQETFEKIKDKALFVDIASIFKLRENYVLSSINWIEKANTIDYTFGFDQVYLAKSSEVEYVVDATDPYLPDLTNLETVDFTDTFIDRDVVDEILWSILKDYKIIDDEFIRLSLSGGVIAGAGFALPFLLKGAVAIGLASGGVGLVVVGVVAAAALVGYGLYMLFHAQLHKQKRTQIASFKYYKDKKKNEAEQLRFINFIEGIYNEIEVLENTSKVYSIAKDVAQETYLTIGGNVYHFEFNRSNLAHGSSLVIKDINNTVVYSTPLVQGLNSLDNCTEQNNLLKTVNGPKVFILNKLSMEYAVTGKSATLKEHRDLRNMLILVTDTDLSQWTTIISDIIENAVRI